MATRRGENEKAPLSHPAGNTRREEISLSQSQLEANIARIWKDHGLLSRKAPDEVRESDLPDLMSAVLKKAWANASLARQMQVGVEKTLEFLLK